MIVVFTLVIAAFAPCPPHSLHVVRPSHREIIFFCQSPVIAVSKRGNLVLQLTSLRLFVLEKVLFLFAIVDTAFKNTLPLHKRFLIDKIAKRMLNHMENSRCQFAEEQKFDTSI